MLQLKQQGTELFFSIVQDTSSDEPPAKKSKTEDDLIPEDQFLKTNPVSVATKQMIANTIKRVLYDHSFEHHLSFTVNFQSKLLIQYHIAC